MQGAVYIFRQLWVSRNICSAHNLIWFVNVSPKKQKLSKMKNYFSDINHWQSVKFFAWYIFRRLLITSAAIYDVPKHKQAHTHTPSISSWHHQIIVFFYRITFFLISNSLCEDLIGLSSSISHDFYNARQVYNNHRQ